MEQDPRSPLDKRLLHKQIYKNARGKTPPWKDVYRKRCMERLRSSRSQLVNRFRSAGDAINNNNNSPAKMVQDIMEIEWAAISQGSVFPSLKKLPVGFEDMPKEDDMMLLSLMEEIQQELINEASAHSFPLRDFSSREAALYLSEQFSPSPFQGVTKREERLLIEVLNYDAAMLASQVAAQQNEEVICPVCQVQGLQEVAKRQGASIEASGAEAAANVLACGCGLALQGANLTLNTVKSSLENTISHHGQSCAGQMSFTPTTDTQGANVLITCSICDWMSFLV
ncbi:RPA-interacting protein-like isoform X1 [Penaeus japonicus]|uniref:RPA-interacting protein-like isoform X1 n=1 Tax=Penaeus japonicus TaxID=27405 RepID=UPI001C70FDD6|nr:RPA-interacting protein-like isoform X1 [Penaeus japonicus]